MRLALSCLFYNCCCTTAYAHCCLFLHSAARLTRTARAACISFLGTGPRWRRITLQLRRRTRCSSGLPAAYHSTRGFSPIWCVAAGRRGGESTSKQTSTCSRSVRRMAGAMLPAACGDASPACAHALSPPLALHYIALTFIGSLARLACLLAAPLHGAPALSRASFVQAPAGFIGIMRIGGVWHGRSCRTGIMSSVCGQNTRVEE